MSFFPNIIGQSVEEKKKTEKSKQLIVEVLIYLDLADHKHS